MRTTFTLDDDVARWIADAVHRERCTMKEVVNSALRRGLTTDAELSPSDVAVRAYSSAVRPGLEQARLNQLADHVVDDAFIGAIS